MFYEKLCFPNKKKIIQEFITLKTVCDEMCLATQWLRLCASTAGGTVSIPGCEAKIPSAGQLGQRKTCYISHYQPKDIFEVMSNWNQNNQSLRVKFIYLFFAC